MKKYKNIYNVNENINRPQFHPKSVLETRTSVSSLNMGLLTEHIYM